MDMVKFANPLGGSDTDQEVESSDPTIGTLSEEDANIKLIFDELDTDGEGKLTREEIAQMLKMLGGLGSDEETQRVMVDMGHGLEDGASAVGFHEFLNWWKSSSSIAVALQNKVQDIDGKQEPLENALELVLYHEPKRKYILQAIPGPRGAAEIDRWVQGFASGAKYEPGAQPIISEHLSIQGVASGGLNSCAKKMMQCAGSKKAEKRAEATDQASPSSRAELAHDLDTE